MILKGNFNLILFLAVLFFVNRPLYASEKKVLILGDEAMASSRLPEDKKIQAILADKSQNVFTDIKIDFENVSSDETSPYDYLNRFDRLMSEHSPDLIIYIVTKTKNLEREIKGRSPLFGGCPVRKAFSSSQKEFAVNGIDLMIQSLLKMSKKSQEKNISFLVVWNMPGLNQDNYLSYGTLCKRILSLKQEAPWIYLPSDIGIKLTNAGVDTVFSNEFRKVYWQEISKGKNKNWAKFQENYIASFTATLFPWIVPFLSDLN